MYFFFFYLLYTYLCCSICPSIPLISLFLQRTIAVFHPSLWSTLFVHLPVTLHTLLSLSLFVWDSDMLYFRDRFRSRVRMNNICGIHSILPAALHPSVSSLSNNNQHNVTDPAFCESVCQFIQDFLYLSLLSDSGCETFLASVFFFQTHSLSQQKNRHPFYNHLHHLLIWQVMSLITYQV